MWLLVNAAASLDITPCFMIGQINWLALLESGINAIVNRRRNGSGFGVGSI
jgi:hypothetical protein